MEGWRKSTLKSMLEGCSWQYALEQVYKEPSHGSPYTALGTGFHSAVENWEKSGRTATLEDSQTVAADSAFEQAKVLPMESWFSHQLDPQWVVDYAKEAVRLWFEKPYGKDDTTLKQVTEKRECLGTEVFLQASHPRADRGLQGTVDALYRDGDSIVIVDYKTASSFRKWTYNQPASIEAAAYLWMVQHTYDAKSYHFEWHIVSPKEGKTRLVTTPATLQEQYKVLADAIKEAEVIAKHQAYRPNPAWNLCQPKWCPYFTGCRETGTLSPYSLPIIDTSAADVPLS